MSSPHNDALPQTPHLGRSRPKCRTVLLVAYFDPVGLMTVRENIAAWAEASAFDFEVLNLWNCGYSPLQIPAHIDFNDYLGVFIHPAVCYFPTNLFSLDTNVPTKFADYDGLKILVKQDEHFRTHEFGQFIKDNRFDILVTCVPDHELNKAYPEDCLTGVSVVNQLTAYVSDAMRNAHRPRFSERPIDISYRGSIQPLICGRLGFEKRAIGEAVRGPADAAGFKTDISSRWEDRINGEAWTRFLASSKAVLGVESGSNLFDFDGSVTEWCDAFAVRNGHMDPAGEEFYLKAHREHLHRFEDNIDYAQISPRHFEAAAVGSLQILYEGRYSDIFVPNRHFFPLKRDLSNIEEAFELLRDDAAWQAMTDAAYEEVILNDRYTYQSFVTRFDAAVAAKLEEKNLDTATKRFTTRATATEKPRALLMMYHDTTADPRIEWMAESLVGAGYEVVELGVHHDLDAPVSSRELGPDRVQVHSRLVPHSWPGLQTPALPNPPTRAQSMLAYFSQCIFAPNSALEKRLGAVNITANMEPFRHGCWEMINGPSILIDAAEQLGTFDAFVGVDLHGLLAAAHMAEKTGCVSMYDAHEYWPAARGMANWEFDFWSQIEQALVADIDIPITVSKQLVDLMSAEYGRDFHLLPNCASRKAALPLSGADKQQIDIPDRVRDNQVTFVFHGGLHRERPVDFLVRSWTKTDPRAVLWIRAPFGLLRDELITAAEETGLLGQRIFFPAPVDEHALIESARAADVGIVPYDPAVSLNYKYASPNKFSQYSAAGIPTLSSELPFIQGMIEENKVGLTYRMHDADNFSAQVNELVTNAAERQAMGERAKTFFKTSYNWDNWIAPIITELDGLVGERGRSAERRPLANLLLPQEIEALDRELREASPTYGWPNFAPPAE